MGVDLDSMDEILIEEPKKNVRALGKFQPKPKFRPPPKDSAASLVNCSLAIQTSDELVANAKPEGRCDQCDSGSVRDLCENERIKDISEARVSLHSGLDSIPSNIGSWHEKSVGENTDIYIGLENLGDFLPHTSHIESTVPPSDAVAPNVLNLENAEGGVDNPVLSGVDDSSHRCDVAINVSNNPISPELCADKNPSSSEKLNVSRSDGACEANCGDFEREEMNVLDSIHMSQFSNKSGQRTGKFQPKSKIQMQKGIPKASDKSAPHTLCSQQISCEIDMVEKDSVSAFQPDDIIDFSSTEFSHNFLSEVTLSEASSELPTNQEPMNLMETITELDSVEGGPEVPAKLASRRAKTETSKTLGTLDPSPQHKSICTSSIENDTVRSLRPRKNKSNICELVDEVKDDGLANEELSDYSPGNYAVEEDGINNEEFQVENKAQTKKRKQMPKKQDEDKDKPARKRKKDKETDAKPKKFSHSTRRRRVDKVLLETPEDEINYRKVPLRDIILLAEHKERQMKKEQAVQGTSANKQSDGNSSGWQNEDGNFTSEYGEEYTDEQAGPKVEEIIINYQTYMEKTPRAKWSKQDTELFYEAVQQFGSDLSMIQQLFPGFTRRQIKLKYKKEEREHPLRLHEALTNRTKDTSHYEFVIKRLQEIAAEENQNAANCETVDLIENEVMEDGTSNAEDETKKECIVEEENEVHEDTAEEGHAVVQSPLNSYESEDDLFRWSEYKE